jgi:hypothetical protein
MHTPRLAPTLLLAGLACGRGAPAPVARDVGAPPDAVPAEPAEPDVGPADVAPPVDPAWEQVVAWAQPANPPAPRGTLDRALEPLRPVRSEVEDLLRAAEREAARAAARAGQRALEPPAPVELPAAAQEALAALLAWYDAEGGLGTTDCSASRDSLPLLTLARAALEAAAGNPDDPRVAAVLRLAWLLREGGDSLIHVMLGSAIASEAVDWAKRRELQPSEAFRHYAPGTAFLFRVLAAEAVCSDGLVARLRTPEGAAEREALARAVNADTPAAVDAAVVAEIATVRSYWIELVTGARERWDDASGVERFLDDRAEAARRRQLNHPVLAVLAVPLGRQLHRLRDAREEYVRFLESAESADAH